MVRKWILCAVLACLATGTVVTTGGQAAAPPAGTSNKADKEKMKEKLKAMIDTNHDGKISKEELAKFKADHPNLKGKLGQAKK